jgi:hypothetical protein
VEFNLEIVDSVCSSPEEEKANGPGYWNSNRASSPGAEQDA